jgi:hypothetical protein
LTAIDLYQKHYVDIQFERAELFEAIKEKYGGSQALYPGSSIHITPSLFFPYVVYVDQHPTAQQFFAHLEPVLDYINRNKRYKRSAYIRFIDQDYFKPLPLKEAEFDLLISLYAGGISLACKKYLRPGGMLLTNNHHDDAVEAARTDEFQLIAVAHYRGGRYRFIEDGLNSSLVSSEKAGKSKRYLRQTNQGVAYIENEDYYVFRKKQRT